MQDIRLVDNDGEYLALSAAGKDNVPPLPPPLPHGISGRIIAPS